MHTYTYIVFCLQSVSDSDVYNASLIQIVLVIIIKPENVTRLTFWPSRMLVLSIGK